MAGKKRSKASMQTLENALLYSNFVKEVRKIDRDFDTEVIDRSLTPEEAWRELKERHHLASREGGEPKYIDEMRDSLEDLGIKHPRLQSFIIKEMDSKGPSSAAEGDGDLVAAAYELQMRPLRNIKIDIAKKARPCESLSQWINGSNRCDVSGVDSKAAKFVLDWFGRGE